MASNTKIIHFGTRVIQATVQHVYHHREVCRVEIPQPGCLSWLPAALRSQLRRMAPEWFLPPVAILKEMVLEYEHIFSNEIMMYEKLQPLQGKVVPRYYGRVAVDGDKPAILVEYIDGKALDELSPQELLAKSDITTPLDKLPDRIVHWNIAGVDREERINPQLLSELRAAYSQLTAHGVLHGDPILPNFVRIEGAIVVIDFGNSDLLEAVGVKSNEPDMHSLLREIIVLCPS